MPVFAPEQEEQEDDAAAMEVESAAPAAPEPALSQVSPSMRGES